MNQEIPKIKLAMIILSLVLVAIGGRIYSNSKMIGITSIKEVELEMNLVAVSKCTSRRNNPTLHCALLLKDKKGNPFITEQRLEQADIDELNKNKENIKFNLLKISYEKNKHTTCVKKITLNQKYTFVEYTHDYQLKNIFMSCPYFYSKREYMNITVPFHGELKPLLDKYDNFVGNTKKEEW